MLRFQLSTVIFQLVNFFLLLAALTWFLYRPLLRVMRQREEDIGSRLRGAEERTRQAEREREALAEERQRAQGEAEALLAHAREEVSRQRLQVLEEARREAATYLADARRRSEEQERAARELLEAEACHTAIAVATGLLARMPVVALHEALVTELVDRRLQGDHEQSELLRRALASPRSTVAVELALPPSRELETHLRRRLAAAWGTSDERLAPFHVEPSLIAGVRVLVGTLVVELSLRGILAELEHEVARDEVHT